MKARIYFLDNLRTIMIFLVVLLHSAITYSHGMDSFWAVVDPNKSEGLALVNMYLDLFIMFIIFYISGYFIPMSVKSKSPWEFIKSKFRRIMVPWIIAVFTLIPAYKAIFLYSRGLPQEAWYSYFTFFQRAGTDLSFYPNHPTQSWLWFLPVLFIFQLIYLGLSKANLSSIKISLKTAVILTFVLGVVYSMIISLTGLKGWFHSAILDFQRERLLIYFMSFMLGALSYKLKVFESKDKHIRLYVAANVVLTIALGVFTAVALNMFFNLIDPARNYFFISEAIDRLVYYSTAILSMLSFLYVFIHAFKTYFNKTNQIMTYLNKSSYSVYIIHLIVLSVIALTMIDLELSGVIKFTILTLLTFIISNVIVIGYQSWFKNNLSLRLATFVVLVIALFGFIRFGDKTIGNQQSAEKSEAAMKPQVSMHEAVIRGDLDIIKQYIRSGSDINEKDITGGSSPLLVAALFDKTEIAKALINAGAYLNSQNNEGSTALHTAAFFGRVEIVKLLLESGADASILNNAGTTALQSLNEPYESVKGIYEYFQKTFAPMGLVLDEQTLKTNRPIIADMLRDYESK